MDHAWTHQATSRAVRNRTSRTNNKNHNTIQLQIEIKMQPMSKIQDIS